MELKEYSISIESKKYLGILIRQLRLNKLNHHKSDNLIEINPYTKENFCDNNKICHYHTLTKLENSYIREDNVYHILLKKLGLYFQIEEEDHLANLLQVHKIAHQMIEAIEKLDYQLKHKIIEEIANLSLENDCIAFYNLQLLTYCIDLYFNQNITSDILTNIEMLLPFYDQLFKPLAYYILGYGYFIQHSYSKALDYALESLDLFKDFRVSIGFTYIPLIDIYRYNNNYYESIQLCNELEEYYIKTNNKSRLMMIYIYLSDYYLLINSLDYAQQYYNEITLLLKEEPSLSDIVYPLFYKWGMSKLNNYLYEEALEYFYLAYDSCKNHKDKLMITNRILICYSQLDYASDKIETILKKVEDYFSFASDLEKLIFNYFIYKLKGNLDYKQFAVDKIIPILKQAKKHKIILLFFYEDLYNS